MVDVNLSSPIDVRNAGIEGVTGPSASSNAFIPAFLHQSNFINFIGITSSKSYRLITLVPNSSFSAIFFKFIISLKDTDI